MKAIRLLALCIFAQVLRTGASELPLVAIQPLGSVKAADITRVKDGITARLVKVVNHELGHTFGLGHCPAPACLMQDARGKIARVDEENGAPCTACSRQLPLLQPPP